MTFATGRYRAALYALFALSGVAGLIYESIWSHYLKLFLGHAAYAQTLVLCIFMGGMAIGAGLAARWISRLRRPLLVYVAVEATLGAVALIFDPMFRGMQAWVFDSLLPQLETEWLVDLCKWGLGTALILPQSILLGTTFPLMSSAVVRLDAALAGRTLGWLYFTNSLGAAIGVLLSGFVLIDLVGLPGTIFTGGLINFVLAASVYLLARADRFWAATGDIPQALQSVYQGKGHLMLLWVAALTGLASFIYEIAWIRMLSLVIGAATHSFELMLSAFITGLALGSFFIRRRIDRHGDLRSLLGWIQLLMGSLALISVPLYLGTFDAMAFWMEAIQRNEPGYTAFTLFSHFLCFVLMLPATFCAGMTLPIITAALIREGGGEREIGRVYAANTLGSIAGVLVAVHVLMPLAGLRLTVMIGAFVDVALGFVLLLGAGVARRHWLPAAASIAALSVTIGLAVQFDPRITGSGVYRHEGVTKNLQEVLFSADGKTATVNVFRYPKSISISTNGKIDAGISTDGTASADDYTMILAAFLPMAHHPQIETAAVIGMGSGRSTHALLHDRRVRMVDTIEIEPAMVQGARQFGDLSDKAFTDARSHIHIEDAKAYFARQGQRYDLILSEPSNPWVSGVASLFTGEFYAQMKRHLKPGGLLVQWLHLYEIDLPLAASVINALTDEFEDYVAYVTNGSDLLLVARADGKVAPLDASVLENADLAPLWTHLGLKSADDLLIRRIGSLDTLAPWMRVAQGASNSDYFPILDQGAVKQRFLRSNAISLTRAVSYARRLELGESPAISGRVADAPLYKPVGLANNAFHYAQYFSAGTGSAEQLDRPLPQELLSLHHDLWLVEQNCSPELADGLWLPALQTLTTLYGPYVPAEPAKLIAARLRKAKCLAGSPLGLAWVDLFEAVTQRNWSQTIVAAEKLLESQNAGFPGEDFVVAELLLADIKKNGYPAALNRSAKLGDRMPNSAPILYLRANIGL